MNLARHCDLCDNQKTSLKVGTTCGLTDRKPYFKDTCCDILLDEKFQRKLENYNLELERINKTKNKHYWTFYFLIVIGFLLIIGNEFYADITQNETYYWYFRASAIGFGITILIGAYFNLNKFREKLKAAKFRKNKIDSVLEKYGIRYKIKINFKEKVHGNQNIEIKTEYVNWTKKRTTTKYIAHSQ